MSSISKIARGALVKSAGILVSMVYFTLTWAAAAAPAQGLEIEGLVLDSAGAAVVGAEVVLRSVASRQEWFRESDASGRFVFSDLADGRFFLQITATGFAAARQQVTVAGQNVAITITLAPTIVSESIAVRAETYQEKTTAIGTKTDTPLLELPQAIGVVNRQLMQDQRAISLDDALKNVAGVTPGGYYRGVDFYRIRGFDASLTTYLDGLRGENGLSEELFGIERVEVLKGPNSALYGQAVLGGLVNLQSKRPRRETFGEVQLSGGSFNSYEAAVDVNSSLNKSNTLYGRLNLLYRPQKSFVNFAKSQRWYATPALTWEMGPATTVTLLSKFQRDRIYYGFPLPAKGTVLPNLNGELPIELNTGEPSFSNHVQGMTKQVGYQFTHRFNEVFSLHQNMRLSWYSVQRDALLYPGYLGDDERTLYRSPSNYRGKDNNFRVDTPLEATFSTGPVRHTALIGIDYYRYPNKRLLQTIDRSDPAAYLPLDLYRPVYGVARLPALLPWTEIRNKTQSVGIYLQDQVKPTERLTLILSGRFDLASTLNNETEPSNKDTAFSPRAGVSYQFVPGAALYASYSESFRTQTGVIYDGTERGAFVDPETGRQWETGIKTSLLDGRATATLALFHLARRNVATTNPANPGFALVTGEQRSQGVELETALQLLSGWNLIAAYAYIDSKVTEDNVIPLGTRTQNVPRNSYNLWTRYEFQRGWARGFGLGAGGRYYSSQVGDMTDTFRIPGHGLMDAAVFYRHGRFRLQLNVNNLLNKRYFTGSYDQYYVLPGAPRNARVTMGWTF
jgi:iron complex outermembrane recepter protein